MARVWDENWFGSTKTLDVHIRWLRQKLGDAARRPALPPHRARRRLPLHRAGGVRVTPARAPAAGARVHPAARDRRARGAARAQPARPRRRRGPLAGARPGGRRRRDRGGQPRRPPRALDDTVADAPPRPSAAASWSPTSQGALLADSAGTDRLGTDYGDRPGDRAGAAHGRAGPGPPPQRHARPGDPRHRRAGGRARARASASVRVTQSVDAVSRATRPRDARPGRDRAARARPRPRRRRRDRAPDRRPAAAARRRRRAGRGGRPDRAREGRGQRRAAQPRDARSTA